jgi:pilus assembly protein Flp/PilA
MRVREKLRRFGISELGATAIEYGLIAALVSVIIIAALRLTGNALNKTFNNIGSILSSAGN